MKRDMELSRQILQQIEEKFPLRGKAELDLPAYSPEQIAYNVMLLWEAGLIVADDCSNFDELWLQPTRLTWEGHEFLDAIKHDTVWNKVKATVKEEGGFVSFEVLKLLAIQAAKSVFGLG
jgi:hypothetical protein